MKLSIYTGIKDGLYFDYHVVDMLRHHLPLADEIIVNEGYSSDGTYEAIKDLDERIKIHRSYWDRSDPSSWSRKFKTQARNLCNGDWCILLDADEFIPEWEFERLREHLDATDKTIVPLRFTHFYGNYKVYIAQPGKELTMPPLGSRIHKNDPNIEIWGDGANVRIRNSGQDDSSIDSETFECHHFGEVRNPARLRQKWRIQAKRHYDQASWDHIPGLLFNLMPHRWDDNDFVSRLAIYEGPYIKAVRENPSEFVRDNFCTYDLLSAKRAS